jgi:LacI family transcriptional regulator
MDMKQTGGPGIRDIARRAGVSSATLDRVMHNRPGVQSHTRSHVLSAIAALAGEHPANRQQVATNISRLDFIICDHGNAFLTRQARELQQYALQKKDIELVLHRPETATEQTVLATLESASPHVQALGIIGFDSHKIRQVLRQLWRRNVPIVTLASDIRNIHRTAYVGIDNHAAGRLAGYLTGRMLGKGEGKVALVLGSRAYLGHEEREMGFRSLLRERFRSLRIVDEREVHESADQAREEVLNLLDRHEDLDAIYCIGAGQLGVARALQESGRQSGIFYVGHGLSADTTPYLTSGTMDVVIEEDAKAEAAAAIDILTAALRGHTPVASPTISIQAVFSENLLANP